MNLRSALDVPASAIVLAEGAFGEPAGKTANGVVLHSELFDVEAVIDSTRAGETPAAVLGNAGAPDAPIVSSIGEALDAAPDAEVLVLGVAPAGGQLPEAWTGIVEDAIAGGCDVVSGLHSFLGDQERWRALAYDHGVRLFDVRKPPGEDALRVGDGSADDVDAAVVVTMGTDCAVGKRTTTFELYRAAVDAGFDAGWVATGQTGIMVGAHAGVVVDRVPSDFTAGVVEDMVSDVGATRDVVFVEGQAALTHPAYSGVALSILHGAWPDAVVLADEPGRERRSDFEQFAVAGVERERDAIERLSDATVAAVSTWGDADEVEAATGLPAGNVYEDDGARRLLAAVEAALS